MAVATPPKMETKTETKMETKMETTTQQFETLTWDVPGYPTKRPAAIDPKEIDSLVNKMVPAPLSAFELRGPKYLVDRKKVPATEPMFQFVDLRSFSHDTSLKHVCRRIKPLRDLLAQHPKREFFVVNRMLPTAPPLTVVSVFVRQFGRTRAPPFEATLQRYKDGKNEVKDLKLKYIVKIPNAPFMLRGAVSALGGFRPVIMGKGYLEQHHYSGPNYTEVDIDVGSSRIARGIMGVVVPQMKKLNVDEAFLIEAQNQDELPEMLLGCQRGARYDFKGEGNEIALTPDMLLDEGDAEPEPESEPGAASSPAAADAPAEKSAAGDEPCTDEPHAAAGPACTARATQALAPTPSHDSSDSDDFADAKS